MTTITKEINTEIAEDFIQDSHEYLERYLSLKSRQTQISNRSKLLIDLVFSLECSLKALIFLESNKDEQETYSRIKKHELDYLIDLISDQSLLTDLKAKINDDTNLYQVNSRYTLEARINFSEYNMLGEKYYETIANSNWLEDLYEIARALLTTLEKRTYTKIKSISFHEIDIQRLIEKADRIGKLSKAHKRKLTLK